MDSDIGNFEKKGTRRKIVCWLLVSGFFIKISLSDGLANLSDLVYT